MRSLILLLIVLLASCGTDPTPVQIPIVVHYGDRPLSCSDDSDTIQLTDLRLFLHDVQLVAADGSGLPVFLDVSEEWQNRDVVLIDLEDGTGACVNGSAGRNATVRGHFAGNAAKGLSFRLGVPASVNHDNPLLAAPPLSYTAMHWHWTTGYKYLRAGIQTPDDGFFLHLGSSHCQRGDNGLVNCGVANRPEIRIPEFVPGTHYLILDLESLLRGVDLADGEPGRCMSGAAETECLAPFANLGLVDGDWRREASPVFRLGISP